MDSKAMRMVSDTDNVGPIYVLGDQPRTFVRASMEEGHTFHPIGPKSADHPTCNLACPACDQLMEVGSWTTLMPLGPGDDDEMRERAQSGRWFNARAIELHWSCATGHPDPS